MYHYAWTSIGSLTRMLLGVAKYAIKPFVFFVFFSGLTIPPMNVLSTPLMSLLCKNALLYWFLG